MTVSILTGDCREVLATLPEESVHCVVTSPPYFGLRDYGHAGQIGLEPTPDAFVAEMVAVFREVRRVLRKDGTCWLNLGDSYATGSLVISGVKDKDLLGIPWMVAFALRADAWYLRQDIIWSKPSPIPEGVRDRCTKSHEYLFLLAKTSRYYYNADEVMEDAAPPGPTNPRARYGGVMPSEARGEAWKQPSKKSRMGARSSSGKSKENFSGARDASLRNRRSVWTVPTRPFIGAHFATFPPDLIEPCIKAGCPEGGTVLDPFGGAGTTGLVADRLQRSAVLIELNPEYAAMARKRIDGDCPMFSTLEAAE